MIFEEIDNVYDAIMLGLSHDTLMVLGWEHIQTLLVRDSAPWADTRIILAGDYGTDLPEGLIPKEKKEKEEWEHLYLENEGNLCEIFSFLSGEDSLEDKEDYEGPIGLSPEERRLVRTITEKEGYQWEKRWVLMNHTKKEYVASMAASRILPSMEATDARSLGQLLISRICWSSCGWSPDPLGSPYRGVWAGDRFVIVTVDAFEAIPSAKGWTDVSVEAAEWLRGLLLAQG